MGLESPVAFVTINAVLKYIQFNSVSFKFAFRACKMNKTFRLYYRASLVADQFSSSLSIVSDPL